MRDTRRKAHILKSEKTLTIPRHIIIFDTETKKNRIDSENVQQVLRLGWACYYRRASDRHIDKYEWCYFETQSVFWHFVLSHTYPKEKVWLIARNIVFDFTVLGGWAYLKKAGYKLKFFYNAGTTSIISVYKQRCSIVFLDSMNWFVESIEKTGERIGLPKLKIDFDTCTQAELKVYGRRDVEIELENFKLFIKFLTEGNIARLCYTRGSTAMSAFLLRHYTTKIYIHNNKQALQLEREAYRGGRVECFFIGTVSDGDFYLLDVNSLYPYVMKQNYYPVKYVKTLHNVSINDLTKYLKKYAIVARVLVDTDIPVYSIRRGRSMFPVGQFVVTLCTPELQYAVLAGHIQSVDTLVLYKRENIFTSYVDKFYNLRQQFAAAGNEEYVELCKKMLNSLYGKFGQKAENWVKIGEAPNEPDRVEVGFVYGGTKFTKVQYLLGEVFLLKSYGEAYDSFPAIAAHVTAYGRLYLWDIMQKAGTGNYFYCDTDSLIVNKQGLDNLANRVSPSILGDLKIADKGNTLDIRGLKDYTFASKNVIKGIRKNAVQITDNLYTQDQWPSFKGMLRKSNSAIYTVKTITKHLTREYFKGTVTDTGLVIPLVLKE
jgi:hypothetical protein